MRDDTLFPAGSSELDLSGPQEKLPPEDQTALEAAYRHLERISYAARLTNLFGRQVELAGNLIPERARKIANRAVDKALRAAMHVALRSLGKGGATSRVGMHRTLATASGAMGGAFGLASLPVELPLSTVILLRAIADIAKAEGEDLTKPETALACMQVFALGGRTPTDDYMDGGYFAIRTLLARTVSEATHYVAATGAANETAPILVRLLSQIAARFGMVVSQKIAAQAVPIFGAVGGAAVNYAFMDHFQNLAHGHFTIRQLERTYGSERVRFAYEALHLKDVGTAPRESTGERPVASGRFLEI
ncbi:MAG: peptidase [Hyphomicrobiales bacterium]|nr:peptidase [Hyphomicrobiales bacterium]